MQDNKPYTLQTLYWKYIKEQYIIVRENIKEEVKAYHYFVYDQKVPSVVFQFENQKFGFLLPRNFNVLNN